MVDQKSTHETQKLYQYLKSIKGKAMLFGHQNTTSDGVTLKDHSGDYSDVENVVGDFPAVYGWDTLALIGVEGTFNELKVWIEKAARRGGIITVSGHMLNPVTDGLFNDTRGNAVTEILKFKGEPYEKFRAHLDLFAQLADCVKLPNGQPVPIIFRPFHENSGDWFWWGKAHCSKEEYLELFQYTVNYLKDTKELHHLIYAYSPNGHFESKEDYLDRYPGDDYIDIVGFDVYHDKPQRDDGWLEAFIKDCQIISAIANERDIVGAITEVGLRWNAMDGLAPTNNMIPDWYTWLLSALKKDEQARQMVYMLNWWNGANGRFWVPYKGHEMAEDFIRFYQDKFVKFNRETENLYSES